MIVGRVGCGDDGPVAGRVVDEPVGCCGIADGVSLIVGRVGCGVAGDAGPVDGAVADGAVADGAVAVVDSLMDGCAGAGDSLSRARRWMLEISGTDS